MDGIYVDAVSGKFIACTVHSTEALEAALVVSEAASEASAAAPEAPDAAPEVLPPSFWANTKANCSFVFHLCNRLSESLKLR